MDGGGVVKKVGVRVGRVVGVKIGVGASSLPYRYCDNKRGGAVRVQHASTSLPLNQNILRHGLSLHAFNHYKVLPLFQTGTS